MHTRRAAAPSYHNNDRVIGGNGSDATKTTCTPAFQSPEEVGNTSVNPYAADLWALGCCLYCFVCGRLPFIGSCVVRDTWRQATGNLGRGGGPRAGRGGMRWGGLEGYVL